MANENFSFLCEDELTMQDVLSAPPQNAIIDKTKLRTRPLFRFREVANVVMSEKRLII